MRKSQKRSRNDIFANAITAFSGSFAFVVLHIVWFAGWIVVTSSRLLLSIRSLSAY